MNRVLALCVLAAFAFFLRPQPARFHKTASIGGISEYEFSNGLRVLLFRESTSLKVTINMTYLVGSRHEGYGEAGMAHLLEHMNFKLSTHNRDIQKELIAHSASFNGSTSYDRTSYFEILKTGDANLKWALGLEAERMVNMRLEKKILDTEMTVVRNEFEIGENYPQRVLEQRVSATAYLWHNYGKATIGSREDIERVPIDRLAAFYTKYYQPDNAVLTISGAFDESKALAYVASTCGVIPKPTRNLEATYTVEPVQDGVRYVELRRVGDAKELVMAWHAPSARNPDSVALSVIAGIMGGVASGAGGAGRADMGRFHKALVDSNKAVSARMSFQQLYDPGLVLAAATLTNDQSLEDARKSMLETVKGIITDPPTQEELDRVKQRMLRQMEWQMFDSGQLGLSITDPISQGDWRLMFLNYDLLKYLNAREVARVAERYFKDSNLTVGEFIPTPTPDRTIVPPAPNLDKILSDQKGKVFVGRVETLDLSPTKIESRIVRSKLPSGMKVVLLMKRTRGETVSVAIEIHFGDEKSLAKKRAASLIAGALLMRGTRTKSRQQIQDEMDALRSTINVWGGDGTKSGLSGAQAYIQTNSSTLNRALRLAVEILRAPAFAESDFEQVRKQYIARLEGNRSYPGSRANVALNRALNAYPKGDVRYIPTLDEQIEELKKLTLTDVRKFHADFYSAGHGELVAVGQFSQREFEKAATELVGDWSTAAPYAPYATTYHANTPINLNLETPDKQNADFESGMVIRLSDTDRDYPAMLLANYMMGGSMIGRLPDRIRNHEGLSYGVNSFLSLPAMGDGAIFGSMAVANPANIPKVEASLKEELARILKNGFSADEVAVAKKSFVDQLNGQLNQDSSLSTLLATRERQGRTLKWDEDLDAHIRALTPELITAAFRAHIDPSGLSIVKAGDFKGAGVYQH